MDKDVYRGSSHECCADRDGRITIAGTLARVGGADGGSPKGAPAAPTMMAAAELYPDRSEITSRATWNMLAALASWPRWGQRVEPAHQELPGDLKRNPRSPGQSRDDGGFGSKKLLAMPPSAEKTRLTTLRAGTRSGGSSWETLQPSAGILAIRSSSTAIVSRRLSLRAANDPARVE